MPNSNKDNDEEKQAPDLGSMTWREIKQLEKAAEAGDLKAQDRLAEIEGLESYEEYKPLLQRIADENPEWLKQLTAYFKPEIDPSLLKGIVDESSEWLKQVTTGLNSQIDPSLFKRITDESSASMKEVQNAFKAVINSDKFPVNDIASNAFLTYYVPSPQEQLRNEIAENNRVNRDILDEMRRQRLESFQELPKSKVKPLKAKNMAIPLVPIRKLNLAFDVLDAATERCLPSDAPHVVSIRRESLTVGSVAYYLSESDLGDLGKVTIRKTGDKKSEIEVGDSPIPEDQEVIEYYYHEFAWRIEDGSYLIAKEDGTERIPASELIPLTKELHQKRRKHLSEIVIPAYFDRLRREDIWPGLEQANLPISHSQSTKAETEKPELPDRVKKLDKLSVLWVVLNQAGKPKDYGVSEFLQEHQQEVGLAYVGKAEFVKHLPKAYKRDVIDKDKKTGRYVPKSGN